jgi:peroxiredoxin
MAQTPSTMVDLGSPAPHFNLPDTDGGVVSLADFAGGRCLVVMFICNHCPFVKRIAGGLAAFGRDYADVDEVGIVAINSNDVENYPDDAPAKMREEMEEREYRFPYLFDETQEVAKAYRAACTPDFFVYDEARRLVYRGQFDAARPGNDVEATGADLRAAVEAVRGGGTPDEAQTPSIGCNIKWKPGNEPAYVAAL